ncbi:hypothetical protein HYT02_02980 [Candidatus Gottesmanbacteria bacterium]|nr:hypothetical protein [Candidatus Gottesmanbacteria bacterium]
MKEKLPIKVSENQYISLNMGEVFFADPWSFCVYIKNRQMKIDLKMPLIL